MVIQVSGTRHLAVISAMATTYRRVHCMFSLERMDADGYFKQAQLWLQMLGTSTSNSSTAPRVHNSYTRAMSRDEGRFPNAEAFVPERFLDEGGVLNDNDPADFVFGFGRRICPGVSTHL